MTHARYASMTWHAIAGGLALCYAFAISNTQHVTNGLQFVSPVLVVLMVHSLVLWQRGALRGAGPPSAALVALRRTVGTTVMLVVSMALAAAFAPMPADAANSVLSDILGVLSCLLVLVVVLAVTATLAFIVGYSIYWALRGGWAFAKRILGLDLPPGGTGLNDLGVLVASALAIGAASLEGVSDALTFAERDRVATTVAVRAPPAAVWSAIDKASSSALPLPLLLRTLPRPTHVIDGGSSLGSQRIVHFKGREGEGDLVLEVTSRRAGSITWSAVRDTTPMRRWAVPLDVTFTVESDGPEGGSRLAVSATYDRKLAPAWFFRPYMRAVWAQVVDVLARDKKERAELAVRP
ncbi:MAG: hypothetical protein R3D67_09060 [Hyphomicrobiaceae bacterium]